MFREFLGTVDECLVGPPRVSLSRSRLPRDRDYLVFRFEAIPISITSWDYLGFRAGITVEEYLVFGEFLGTVDEFRTLVACLLF